MSSQSRYNSVPPSRACSSSLRCRYLRYLSLRARCRPHRRCPVPSSPSLPVPFVVWDRCRPSVPPFLSLCDIGPPPRTTISANVALTHCIIPTFPSFAEFFTLILAQPSSNTSSSLILLPSSTFRFADFLSLTDHDYRGGCYDCWQELLTTNALTPLLVT